MLPESQRKILAIVAANDGGLNWYKIGRAHLHELDSPAVFDAAITGLKKAGFLEERLVGDEQLPRLFLTNKAREELRA